MGKEIFSQRYESLQRKAKETWVYRRIEGKSHYYLPETVGRRPVARVELGEHPYSEFNQISLDIPMLNGKDDRSIRRVPVGWFNEGDTAEIIVRRVIHMHGTPFSAPTWLVAIRPYEKGVSYKPLQDDDLDLHNMLFANRMKFAENPAFYKRFIENR